MADFSLTSGQLAEIQRFGINLIDPDVKQPYINNPWVYSCINKITKTIIAVPRNIYDRTAITDRLSDNSNSPAPISSDLIKDLITTRSLRPINTEIDTNSAYYKLFLKPNILQDGSDFFKALITYCLLPPGDVFLLCLDANNEPISTPDEVPDHIFLIPGSEVQPHMTGSGTSGFQTFQGWNWSQSVLQFADPNRPFFLPFQLQQFRLDINPYNPVRGLDPLTSAFNQYKIDNITDQYNQAFFKQGASPSGYLYVESKLDPKEREGLEERWQKRYGGKDNAGKTPVLSGGIKFIPTEATHDNMQFDLIKKASRQAICSVYDVPPSELGITENANNGINVAQHAGWWRNGLIPIIRKIETFLEWRFFGPTSKSNNLFLAFDLSVVEALRGDLDLKSKIARQFWEIGYPPNIINDRLELGMGPIELGDLQFIAPGFLPMKEVIDQARIKNDLMKKNQSISGNPGPEPKIGPASPGQDNNTKALLPSTPFNRKISNILYKLRTGVLSKSLTGDRILDLRAKFEEINPEIEIFDIIVKNIPIDDPPETIREYFNEISVLLGEN